MRILGHRLPELPQGYDFDACTTDALLHRMRAEDGRIILPDGISYRVMILPPDGQLTAEASRQIDQLRRQGVAIYDPQTDGRPLAACLREAGILPDVEAPNTQQLYFAHRRTAEEDVYFLNNHSDEAIDDRFVFNTATTAAELWNPVTGERQPLVGTAVDGRMAVRLAMAPRESFFIVCHNGAGTHSDRRLSSCVLPLPSCPWQVTFDPQMGGPSEPVTFDKLTDWTKNGDPRIRYYSGTAVYRNTLELKKKDAQVRYLLNLGKLNGAAEVIVNGASAGIVWCSPWRIDVTRQLRKGSNRIEIRVANCLWNRLVGDALLPESGRIIRQTHPLAKPDDKLIPSGLTL